MSEKWINIQIEHHEGNASDANDLIIHYSKKIDGEWFLIEEQGGKILSKKNCKNIIY